MHLWQWYSLAWARPNAAPMNCASRLRSEAPDNWRSLTLPLHGHGMALQERPDKCCKSRISLEKRSEEHTSELQSLMRISYAVFCLKKKNNIHDYTLKKNDRNIIQLTNVYNYNDIFPIKIPTHRTES